MEQGKGVFMWPSQYLQQPLYMPPAHFPPLNFYYQPNFLSMPNFSQTSTTDLGNFDQKNESRNMISEGPLDKRDQIVRKEENHVQKIETERNYNMCNCSKSKCLKDYCLCFKNGKSCGENCKCIGCKNTEIKLRQKPSKNKKNESRCNCFKSRCEKKYCECFAAGRKCGSQCICKDCQN